MIDKAEMKSEILKFFNSEDPYIFPLDPPPTSDEVQEKQATLWKNVFLKGFQNVIPASTTASVAADALFAALNIPQMEVSDGGALFYGAVATFYNTLGGGMAGYTFVPPPPLVLSAPTDDPEIAAESHASIILANGLSGTATNVISGVTTPWQ